MNRDDVVRCLTRAADLVEQGFLQQHWSVDARGRSTDPESPEAVAWCADGAIARALYEWRPYGDHGDYQWGKAETDAYECLARHARARFTPEEARVFSGFISYNDQAGMTGEKMAAFLRSVAAQVAEPRGEGGD